MRSRFSNAARAVSSASRAAAASPRAPERSAEAHVELDRDAAPQRVVHALLERQLPLEVLDGLRVAPLESREMAEAHVGADDHDPLLTRERRLLEGDGTARGGLPALELPEERGAMGELQGVPAPLGVSMRGRGRSTPAASRNWARPMKSARAMDPRAPASSGSRSRACWIASIPSSSRPSEDENGSHLPPRAAESGAQLEGTPQARSGRARRARGGPGSPPWRRTPTRARDGRGRRSGRDGPPARRGTPRDPGPRSSPGGR